MRFETLDSWRIAVFCAASKVQQAKNKLQTQGGWISRLFGRSDPHVSQTHRTVVRENDKAQTGGAEKQHTAQFEPYVMDSLGLEPCQKEINMLEIYP